jgi:lysophospholipase
MWEYMKTQVTRYPELALGGPSIHWLGEAMLECQFLMQASLPSLPAVCFVGDDEAIVDTDAMHKRVANWPSGSLELIQKAQHEVLMEGPEIRNLVLDKILDVFERGTSQA